MRKILKSGALILALCMFVTLFSVAAVADSNSGDDGLNVMLVIDGSGSLVGKRGTDPDGMRYNAIADVLGVLCETGKQNEIAAIVFSAAHAKDTSNINEAIHLDTGFGVFDGSDVQRDNFIARIQTCYPGRKGYDPDTGNSTDIGTAMLRAVEELQAQQAKNGKRSILFLFSDGLNSVDNTFSAQSDQNMKAATEAIRNSNGALEICGVFLNQGGKLTGSDVYTIVWDAMGNTGEIGNHYIPITDADSLHEAITKFEKLIIGDVEIEGVPLPVDKDIEVSGGALSLSCRIYTTDGNAIPDDLVVQFTKPDGTLMTEAEMAAVAHSYISVRNYIISEPAEGTWHIKIDKPGSEYGNVAMQASIKTVGDYSVVLSSTPSANSIAYGTTATVNGTVMVSGEELDNYNGWTAELTLSNDAEQKVYPMVYNGSCFTTDVEVDFYGSYTAQIKASYHDAERYTTYSNQEYWDMNNAAPTVQDYLYKDKFGLFEPAECSFALPSGIAYDTEDGDNLAFTVVSSSCDRSSFSFDEANGEFAFEAAALGKGETTIELIATDTQGKSSDPFTVTIQLKDVTVPRILMMIAAAVLLLLAVMFRLLTRARLTGKITVSFYVDKKQVEGSLTPPGTGSAKRKLSLYTAMNASLTESGSLKKDAKAKGVDGAVDSAVKNARAELQGITLMPAAGKNKEGKRVAQLKIKQGKKTYLLYNKTEELYAGSLGNIRVSYNEAQGIGPVKRGIKIATDPNAATTPQKKKTINI